MLSDVHEYDVNMWHEPMVAQDAHTDWCVYVYLVLKHLLSLFFAR